MYRVVATVTHHTNDHRCVSRDVTVELPPFLVVGARDAFEAEALARRVICPVDLQYESVTVTVVSVTPQ